MKKKLSRLLCALLVMTMVLAMVPAVSAAGEGMSASNPIELYVGEELKADEFRSFKCQTHNAKTTTTCTLVDASDNSVSTKSGYVTYSSGYITAKSTTLTTRNGNVEENVAKFTMKCSTKDCTESLTRYYKVYSTAKGVTLKDASGTTISDTLRISKGEELKVYYTLNPVTMNPENITAETEDSAVAVVTSDGWDMSAGKPYFTVKGVENGCTTKLVIKLDEGRSSKVTKTVTIITGGIGLLTLKNGNDIVSKSNYETSEIQTLNAAVDDTLTLTPMADAVLGKASDVSWSVTGSADISISSVDSKTGKATFKVEGTGSATITADLNSTKAKVNVLVLSKATKVEVVAAYSTDTTKSLIDDGEMAISDTLNLKAKITPSANQTSAENAKWTITSGSSHVEFTSKNVDADDSSLAKGETVTLKPKKAGTFTLKVELGGKSDELTMKINAASKVVYVKSLSNTSKLSPTVRDGSTQEIVDQMNSSSSAYRYISATTTENETIYVPVEWRTARKNNDGTATVYGLVMSEDEDGTIYDYSQLNATSSLQVTATAKLSNEATISKIEITSSKDLAIADDRVTLTANAEVMPSNATVKYQWYVNGKSVKDATSKTYTYTIPKASSDSSTSYKFKCEVTATYKGESTSTMSKEYTVSVSRDYAVSVSTSTGKTSFTVGNKPELEATLTYKGSKVSNPSVTWKIYDEKENSIDSNVATLSASGSTATLTTKAVKNASGDKIVVRATISANGQSFSSSETLTIKPAEASTVKQSVGSGAALKASSITSAVTKAAGSNAKLSYIIFNTPKSCTLQKSSSSSSSIGDTKCYVSTTSGQKLSDVYVKTSASSASVTYTAYDADDYVLATGTVSFDANDTGDTITASGASLKTIGAIDQITGEYANADYVKFDLPKASEGKLYYDYTTIADFGGEVKDSDKYYLDASSSQNDIEDVYFLPAAGVTGKFKIDYTAYSSSNSDLGSGTITVTIKSKTSSDKFTDVSTKTGFQWAADSIDFGADNGIIKGATTYTFAPSQSLTRAQLVTILYRAAGSPSVSGVTNPFKDTKNDYYTNAMLWAYKNSIVTGTSATTFSPDSPVTREQIAAILYRYMGSPTATGSLTGFTDRAKVSTYATTAMQWAIGKGYITGIGTKLDPKGNATRAQVAVIIHRFLTK